ncbi:MAG: hypothetical protein ACP5LX_06220 [Nitrososphaeria archaeon]
MEREEKERLIATFVMGILGALAGYSLMHMSAEIIMMLHLL